MTEHLIKHRELASWFRKKAQTIAHPSMSLAAVGENFENVPSAYADFDSVDAIGRIVGSVRGLFDFEVLRRADAKQVFYRFVDASSVDSPNLEIACADFLESMLNPNRFVSNREA